MALTHQVLQHTNISIELERGWENVGFVPRFVNILFPWRVFVIPMFSQLQKDLRMNFVQCNCSWDSSEHRANEAEKISGNPSKGASGLCPKKHFYTIISMVDILIICSQIFSCKYTVLGKHVNITYINLKPFCTTLRCFSKTLIYIEICMMWMFCNRSWSHLPCLPDVEVCYESPDRWFPTAGLQGLPEHSEPSWQDKTIEVGLPWVLWKNWEIQLIL